MPTSPAMAIAGLFHAPLAAYTGAMDSLDALAAANDHFALFGLPRQFDLDPPALQSRYLELARMTHPDFAGADAEAQMRAMELSARVNEAHRTLADPELRANYLLKLLGGADRDADPSLPPGFLEDIMDLRESLAEAQMEQDQAKLATLRATAAERRQQHLTAIARLFASLGSADPQPVQIARKQAIRRELNALRYIQRMLEQA